MCYKSYYTMSHKKKTCAVYSFGVSSPNIAEFSKFFHLHTQLQICSKIFVKDPTTPRRRHYTTL